MIATGCGYDDGSHPRVLPSLRPNCVDKEDRDHGYAPNAYTADDGRVETAGKIYKQVQSFTCLESAVTETMDMSVETARRAHSSWLRIRRYLRELYDRSIVSLSLKTRMVKAEVIEALCGCVTWTIYQEHYSTLLTAHNRALLCIDGARRKRLDHRMTSNNCVLEITWCENIEITLRARGIL